MGACEIGLVQVFGLSPRYGFDHLERFARTAEGLGFASIWAPEHVAFFSSYESQYPYPPEPGSEQEPQLPAGRQPAIFDPLMACQALAAHTSTVRVGTAIALVPLRHPLMWARQLATLDHAAGGRLDFGVGVGWMREEFDALGVPFEQRGSMTDEYLMVLRRLWTDDVTTYSGRHVQLTDVLSFPKPVQQPGPPVLIGGESDGALRRVARLGDGWFGWNMTPDEFERHLGRLDDHLAKERFVDDRRRDRSELTIQVGLAWQRSFAELAELIDAYVQLGATRVAVGVPIRHDALEDGLGELAAALGLEARI
ncbi:MAG: LLM class F420-dependent oxidoreductase [Ilumatobacteraceae bacterium]